MLSELLTSGHLGGAGLDVYSNEPHVSPALLRAPRVVLAPHIGSADTFARDGMARLAYDALSTSSRDGPWCIAWCEGENEQRIEVRPA